MISCWFKDKIRVFGFLRKVLWRVDSKDGRALVFCRVNRLTLTLVEGEFYILVHISAVVLICSWSSINYSWHGRVQWETSAIIIRRWVCCVKLEYFCAEWEDFESWCNNIKLLFLHRILILARHWRWSSIVCCFLVVSLSILLH